MDLQLVLLAAKKLTKYLAPYGYDNHKIPFPTGLWKHKSCPITFTIDVKDFGVKINYNSRQEYQYSARFIGNTRSIR